jgi:hypothetical protein
MFELVHEISEPGLSDEIWDELCGGSATSTRRDVWKNAKISI